MKRSNRLAWLGAIALGAIIFLTLFSAPHTSQLTTGSSYNRSPNGYGAWYAFMQQQGTNIHRWQKPFRDLDTEKYPITLIQVHSYLTEPELDGEEKKWIEKGNNLVILGVREHVSAANFSTLQKSSVGDIQVKTRRRRQINSQEKIDLGDRFGAVVWEKQYGKGKAIFATTPYLAANAYQDNRSNFQYLSDLVSKKGNTLLIDEYIHGYQDKSVRNTEAKRDLVSYLVQTPLFVAFVQVGILLLVLIWAKNRRFGNLASLDAPVTDNDEAYIQALAGVLQKAESRDFVLEVVGKEEKLQLQKALGLGQELVEDETLVNAWVQQTAKEAALLNSVLKLQTRKRRISEKDLLRWLEKWQTIRRMLTVNS